MTIRERLAAYVSELPNALFLAFTTAAVTLVLAVILSAVLGGENTAHRIATRCYAAQITNMLHDAFRVNAAYDEIRAKYPRVNLEGIDCTFIEAPFEPGQPEHQEP